MAVTLLLLIIFLVLAKLGSKLFRKIFYKASNNEALGHLFSTTVYGVILSIGLFTVLGVLGMDKALTSILVGIGDKFGIGFCFSGDCCQFCFGYYPGL
jgi:small conductance mechanosensitive channel